METTNHAKTAGSGTISGGGAESANMLAKEARPRTFDELKESEQIQTLRREIQITRALLNSQQGVIDRLVRHSHAPDGTPSIPAFERQGMDGCDARRDPLA